MRNLNVIVGCAISVAFGLLAGCHGGASPSIVPIAGTAVRGTDGTCAPAKALTICVHVSQTGPTVTVTDTIYGDDGAMIGSVECPGSGSAYICAASFDAPSNTLNQIEVSASGGGPSAEFPVDLEGKKEKKEKPRTVNAIVEGTSLLPVSKVAVVPFHSTTTQQGATSTLPLGQTEQVWIVAYDAQNQVIVGSFPSAMSITTSSNLTASVGSVSSTTAAEGLTVDWVSKSFAGGSGSPSGSMTATIAGSTKTQKGSAKLLASSGVVYYPAGPDSTRFGPGPAALSPDGSQVYFVINDDSDAGCRKLGTCTTLLERFTPSTGTFAQIKLRDVPGVSDLYVTSDGTLWMSTFQPVGAWSYPLPALKMAQGFAPHLLQTLATSDFGEPSGFVADGRGNLWISSCKAPDSTCKQYQKGEPVLIETTVKGTQHADRTIKLPMSGSCTKFGYFGYSVGDVSSYHNNLYVLGINDGSAPPARGNVWQIDPASGKVTCPAVPANFNPSPYFAPMSNLTGSSVLTFGAGGNNANFRWQPNHGFYILSRSGTKTSLIWDGGPGVTANHVSVSPNGGVLYYASSGKLDLRFSGLGTYEPSANPTASPSAWSIFPSASFSGDQSDNGVAASGDGAWYTANGVCLDPKTGNPWNGVCLADAIYLKEWGALPGLKLPQIKPGNSTGFGVITNPEAGSGNGIRPFSVHSGPFYTQWKGYDLKTRTYDKTVCSVQLVTALTFSVTGSKPGFCQILIIEKKNGKSVVSQPLVTNITGQ